MPQGPIPPRTIPKFDLFPENWTDVRRDHDQRWMCLVLFMIGLGLYINAVLMESYR